MRVGFISAEYPPAVGGVGDHTARLARHMAAAGHTVHVVTGRWGGTSTAPELTLEGPRVQRSVTRWDWRILLSIPRLAHRQAWDVAHIQYQPAAYGLHAAVCLLSGALQRLSRPPLVVTTFHDLREPYLFPKAGPLRRLAVRQLARGSDGIVAVAEEDLAQLASWTVGSGVATAVEHVPLGNHFEASPPPDFNPTLWRAGLGIPPDARLVGHLGFVNRSKGIDALVRATAELVEAGRDVHLLMIGDRLGSSDATNRRSLAEVDATVAACRLQRRVHWTGHQSEAAIAGWLRCLDVMALPFVDGATLRRTSLIAAWSHGVPVVTTTPPQGASWSTASIPAVALPAPTPQRLAVALGELLDHPQLRQRLAETGRDFARRFSWPAVTARTLELYRAAREARARRRPRT